MESFKNQLESSAARNWFLFLLKEVEDVYCCALGTYCKCVKKVFFSVYITEGINMYHPKRP